MKKSKGLLIASIVVGVLTVISVFGFSFSLFAALTSFGIDITDAVYVKQSDLVINYSQNNPNEIESYEVKIVNTTNKEFIDYEVRLTLYIVNGSQNHYPHGSTATKIISIKPKEEKTIVFDDVGYLTTIDLDGYYGESLELEYQTEKATSDHSAFYDQFDNGKDFNGGIDKVYTIGCIISGMELLACFIVEIVLIIKYSKSGKKLIQTMIKDKQWKTYNTKFHFIYKIRWFFLFSVCKFICKIYEILL